MREPNIKFSLLVAISVLITLWPPPLVAHMDPTGDIYPDVTARDNIFIIRFWNTLDQVVYERRVTEDGQVLVERDLASDPSSYTPYKNIRIVFEFVIAAGSSKYRFFWNREKREYILETRLGDASTNETILKLDGIPVSGVHDAQLFNGDVFLLVTSGGEERLRLVRFKLEHMGKCQSLDIGNPERISVFPITSQILKHRSKYYLLWLRSSTNSGAGFPQSELVLTWWDPLTGQSQSRLVQENLNWNTCISAAVIGSSLLAAFHQSKIGSWSRSIIEILHIELE